MNKFPEIFEQPHSSIISSKFPVQQCNQIHLSNFIASASSSGCNSFCLIQSYCALCSISCFLCINKRLSYAPARYYIPSFILTVELISRLPLFHRYSRLQYADIYSGLWSSSKDEVWHCALDRMLPFLPDINRDENGGCHDHYYPPL